MEQTRQTKRYLRQIKRLIPSDYTGRKEILAATQQRIEDYLMEHPGAAISGFEEEFGTPEEIADSFLDEISGSRREHRLRRKNKWFIIGGCILVILSLCLVRYTLYLIEHTVVEKTETLIIYSNEPDPWEE